MAGERARLLLGWDAIARLSLMCENNAISSSL